jgi:hypothetical protein
LVTRLSSALTKTTVEPVALMTGSAKLGGRELMLLLANKELGKPPSPAVPGTPGTWLTREMTPVWWSYR